MNGPFKFDTSPFVIDQKAIDDLFANAPSAPPGFGSTERSVDPWKATPVNAAKAKNHNEFGEDGNMSESALESGFINACKNGHMEVAKFILEYKESQRKDAQEKKQQESIDTSKKQTENAWKEVPIEIKQEPPKQELSKQTEASARKNPINLCPTIESRTLMITGYHGTFHALSKLLSKYGENKISIPVSEKSQQKGLAFVEFEKLKQAKNAKERLDGREFVHKKRFGSEETTDVLSVKYSKSNVVTYDPSKGNPNYKKSICYQWRVHNDCPYGENCHFAHGKDEISYWNKKRENDSYYKQ